MIPSALVSHLEEGMRDFLRASFWSASPAFDGLLDRFLESRDALFKGPYISMQLPFKQGNGQTTFARVPLKHPPYAHQELAFKRLGVGKNTIVATGTGSGKTECFAVPLLAHCAERLSERGIKAIILYPMNALANDQAERLAQLVHDNEILRGNLNIGMYVGQHEKSPHTTMGPAHVITDRNTLRSNPPDILLTNYKMLDYLLLRPEDQPLWQDNGPETLKYLVVDELHTFDGAQGTDLACLIRRLRARLGTPKAHLCAVGTSATLSSDSSAAQALIEYATQVFGEAFDSDAIVRESRLDSRDFLLGAKINADPDFPIDKKIYDPAFYLDETAYLNAQMMAWFGKLVDPVELGSELKKSRFLINLLGVFDSNNLYAIEELAHELFSTETPNDPELSRLRTLSLLALTSTARRENGLPFVQIRIQLWQRELRRMVASVGPQPQLNFHDDLQTKDRQNHLPVVYCRDCGLMGWGCLVSAERSSHLQTNLQDFYKAYFDSDSRVSFIFLKEENPEQQFGVGASSYWLNHKTLIRQQQKPDSLTDVVEVVIPASKRMSHGRLVLDHDCPQCLAPQGLSLLGYQAASLTSTFIGQLFASRFNSDRRLLTFSDSVQDAAHRAGFFGARTWSFNVRIAIQHVVASLDEELTLQELTKRVPEYWRAKLGDSQFVATFIPPNLEWMNEYEELKSRGELKGTYLTELVTRRMSWEVYQEYTFRSEFGRTLQRSGASALKVDQSRFDKAVALATQRLFEELRIQTDHTSMAHALMGFVVRMRTRGAVYYPDLPHDYLKSGGKNTFVFGKKWAPFLPLAGPGTRLPAFWTDTSGTARFEHINGQSAGSWAPRWVTRVLESNHMMMASFARETTEVLLRSMVDAGLVEKHTDQITTWGLKLDALSVTKDLVQMRTSKARLRHWVPRAEAAVWEGMQALTQPAGGVWQAVQAHVPAGSGYYAVLYNSGDVTRVNTAEHTGLLERDEREQVETSFKTEPQRPWDVNLLSCTPTLEMGIDIGLLSTAILCSVPPGVANYIQRVGRAGRKDGNSLILTIANGTEHDLYFFANPLEMLKGHVEPPGVFLNASAVLNRQLTAYCLDRWISQKNITRKDFPKKVQEALSGLKRYEERDKFPHNFIEYVDLNQSLLLSGFFNLFEEMTDETREKVTTFMRGGHGTEGSLPWSLIHRLQGLSAERDQRQSDVKSLSSRIKKIEALPTRSPAEEEELSELRRERRAIEGLLRSLNDRDTLNFLTDEGLIPNYAFPEAGVSLKSIIWKRTKEGEDEAGAHYENLEFSYERPARSAIVELAPDAKFYAGGRRVRVNQVDIKKTVPEPWRFCPSCTYADVASGTHTKNCPSCDSPGWGDAGQKREMLKLSQVFAWTKDSESRIDDERDEREASFFNKQMLVHFPGDMKSEAWHLTKEEVPFGAEYVAGATFREINFGPRKSDGTKFTIAGVEAVREGFVLCNSCGMVQGKTKVHHAPSCKFKNAPQAATYETALYLYREFKSEAVRLLLPFIDEPGQSRKLHSFVAALELGLRKYFGGKIDHLQSALHSEPSEEGHRRKQFLVLYDTVPGGTGYLREMIRDEKRIFEILEKAQATLRSCPCVEEEDKDGCYRCVYAYRHARDMADTSRSTAFEEISRILSHRDTWKPIQSLGKVSISALLDSLLEAKFIEALIRRVEAAGGEVNKILIRGKTGYGLNLGEHSWRLEPQVDIGEAQGVVKHSRVDFVLWPEREGDMRPIAVFTDGIKYHQHRLEVDFAQRMALLASERYWVFSLTWDDVEAAMEGGSPNVADILQTPSANTDLMRKALQILARQNSGFTQNWDFGLSSFDLLFHIMSTRSVKMFKEAVGATTLALAAGQRIPQDVWQNNIGEFCVPNVADSLKTSVGPSWMTGGVEVPDPQTRGPAAADVRVFVALAAEAAQTGDISQSVGILWIDDTPQRTESDDFKRQWKAFLWALNRLQMLRTLFVLTSEKQHEVEFSQLLNLMTIPYGADAHAAHREAWNTVFEFSCFDPEIRRIAEGWRDLPPPEAGFDFMANNRQVGFAELAWVEAKVAILLPPDQDEEYARSRKAFEHHGWLVFDFLEVTVGELGHAIESRGGRR